MLTRTEHRNMQPRTALLSVRSNLELVSCLKALPELVLSSIIMFHCRTICFNDASELEANFSLRDNERKSAEKRKEAKRYEEKEKQKYGNNNGESTMKEV